MNQDPLQKLKTASDGLEYPSESDTPFDFFHWPAGKSTSGQRQIEEHNFANRKITQVAIDEFFSALGDSEDAPRFIELRHVLEANLKDLKIFRAGEGETRVDIYLIGQTLAGEWAGLHTVSVET